MNFQFQKLNVKDFDNPQSFFVSIKFLYPGGFSLSTQPGASKNDPLGPVPAKPDGAAIFHSIVYSNK